MDISDNFRKEIVKEIGYIVTKMDKSQNPEEKLYYFSGVHSIIQRIFNLEYNPNLIYAHFVLLQTYNAFNARLQAILKGGEMLIPLNKEHFDKLSKITKELAKKINGKEDIDETLKKFAILSYTTTGNGYYLQQKGLLKIQSI